MCLSSSTPSYAKEDPNIKYNDGNIFDPKPELEIKTNTGTNDNDNGANKNKKKINTNSGLNLQTGYNANTGNYTV